jgi:hypothetical protein
MNAIDLTGRLDPPLSLSNGLVHSIFRTPSFIRYPISWSASPYGTRRGPTVSTEWPCFGSYFRD